MTNSAQDDAIKALIKEFRVIKETLQPIAKDVKKINEIEVEFRKFKNDVNSQIKKLDFETRRISSHKTGNLNAKKIQELERQIQQKMRKASEMIEDKGKIDHLIKRLAETDKWFREREKHQAKEMNIRKRHIEQIAEELNDARQRDHISASNMNKNKKEISEIKAELVNIKNDVGSLNKSVSTKVENSKINDVLINFSRLDKKATADVGEVKGRMRELERKIIQKKDIDLLQTQISEKMRSEIKHLEETLKKVSKYETSIKSLKREVSELATKEQYDYIREVITKIKNDADTNTHTISMFKKDLIDLISKTKSLDAIEESIKPLTKEINQLSHEMNMELSSVKSHIDRIDIKVENTSKILKDLDKVL